MKRAIDPAKITSEQRPTRILSKTKAVNRANPLATSAGQSNQAGTDRKIATRGTRGKTACGVHSGHVAAVSTRAAAATRRLKSEPANSARFGSQPNEPINARNVVRQADEAALGRVPLISPAPDHQPRATQSKIRNRN